MSRRFTPTARRLRLPAGLAVAVGAALLVGASPAWADVAPTLTAFGVSATQVDVTAGDAHVTVTMSVHDPDATGAGTGSVLARRPTRGYHPSGSLVQVGGTATDTQYRADITLPAGQAIDYRLSISFLEAGQFTYADLNTQLYASSWPSHVNAIVTAPPAAPRNLTFHRQVIENRNTVVVSWDPPAAGAPVATGSTVLASSCGTLWRTHPSVVLFTDLPAGSTCSVTVALTNSAGSSPATSGSGRPSAAAARIGTAGLLTAAGADGDATPAVLQLPFPGGKTRI
jgi:hypothetical protein